MLCASVLEQASHRFTGCVHRELTVEPSFISLNSTSPPLADHLYRRQITHSLYVMETLNKYNQSYPDLH